MDVKQACLYLADRAFRVTMKSLPKPKPETAREESLAP